ncbi:hypothetical protein OEZ85_005935 [Tetradesmus obliquus]|uniref:Pherophorin domain-containing protein n=1 Tax=Tetradesmus obliquus TaxID=3088 RepID=A0ABY8UFY0_TETOB|nr:hypothetical protein OEZ85_005935 [Tetradesmus obliquus]
MKPCVQLLAASLLLVCLCTPASAAVSLRQILQDGNPWKAYALQQRGNMRNSNSNGVKPRDMTYLPLSDSSAGLTIYATYDSTAGAITKISATGTYQFCAATPGETQCAAAAACTGRFATDNPCSVYGGLGPCGVALKGARKNNGGITPTSSGFSIKVDLRSAESGTCPRRRAAARRLLQTPPMLTSTQMPTTQTLTTTTTQMNTPMTTTQMITPTLATVTNTDDDMEPDQTVNLDGVEDPSELKPTTDDDDVNMPSPTPLPTAPNNPVKPVAMPGQAVPISMPTTNTPIVPTTGNPIPTTTTAPLTPQNPTSTPVVTTNNTPVVTPPPTNGQGDDMEPDQNTQNDDTLNDDNEDDTMDNQDDNEDDSDIDVTVTNTSGPQNPNSGGGQGGGKGKGKLSYYGGRCDVALLIKSSSSPDRCACFSGVTTAKVGRRAPRMASGNGGSNRGPVVKRWKCSDLVPQIGGSCACS